LAQMDLTKEGIHFGLVVGKHLGEGFVEVAFLLVGAAFLLVGAAFPVDNLVRE